MYALDYRLLTITKANPSSRRSDRQLRVPICGIKLDYSLKIQKGEKNVCKSVCMRKRERVEGADSRSDTEESRAGDRKAGKS